MCPWDWQCGELNICSGGRCQVPLCSQAANPFIPFCWGCNWTLKMWLIIHGWDALVLTAVGVTFMTKCQPLSMSDAWAPGSRDLKWLSKIWKPHLPCFYLSYQGQSYNFCRRGVIHFLFYWEFFSNPLHEAKYPNGLFCCSVSPDLGILEIKTGWVLKSFFQGAKQTGLLKWSVISYNVSKLDY